LTRFTCSEERETREEEEEEEEEDEEEIFNHYINDMKS